MAKSRTRLPGFEELLNQDLKTGDFRSVYVFDGEDQLRIEQVVETIRNKAIDPAAAAFNEHVLQGDQIGWEHAIQQAQGFPMLGGRQLVWVRHADAIKSNKDDPGERALANYLAAPLDTTILVLTGQKFDGRKGWLIAAKKSGFHFHFEAPKGQALMLWVRKAAEKAGLSLDHAAIEVLVALVGNDLQGLRVEIEKLALLQESRGKAPAAEEIPALVMDQAQLEIFGMTDSIGPGRAAELLRIWRRLSTWGSDAYALTPLVCSHLRKTALAAACRADGIPEAAVSSTTGINAWVLRNKIKPLIDRVGVDGCRRALEAGLDCERSQKRRPLPPELAFEQLLLEITRSS